jgi:nitrate/TMAO reductase-like tetraheme cytochrome c subunit
VSDPVEHEAPMGDETPSVFARLRVRLEHLPLAALLVIGLFVVAGSAAGGFYAYKTYDYVQHDNEFCFSCHLMSDPYELFGESAHRGLGCKACHQPNIIDRSMMGLTAVMQNPDSISVHAAVPNDLCADCHVRGDPEKWTLVANSSGHRVHFESEDSVLEGLQCVECHSSSLHQFAAVDETCAQSGCHTDTGIQLGAMSDLTIHCAACHGFSTPAQDLEGAAAGIAPDRSTCLSCHAMRVLVDMPEDEPHEGVCASCHNPHDQETPAEAASSCATAECHTDPASLTPFHEGLQDEVLTACLYCHQAHDFRVDGEDCVACHQGILEDDPTAVPRSEMGSDSTSIVGLVRTVHASMGAPAVGGGDPSSPSSQSTSRLRAGTSARSFASRLMHSWGYPLPQEDPDFLHSEHQQSDCADCHQSVETHGQVTVTTVTDCQSCHHAGEAVEPDGCARCHEESGSTGDPYEVRQSLSLSTGSAPTREMAFAHGSHEGLDCATCHTEGVEKSAAATDCASCHEDHHGVETDCRSCHVTEAADPHVIETAHVTCSGAGCHQDLPFEGVPRTRDVCLVCHQDQGDHEVEQTCSDCHAMPDVGG